MEENTKKRRLWGDWDGEYMGNIWGWKFSLFGLGLIVFLLLLMLYQYSQLEEWPIQKTDIETVIQKDSL